MCQNNETWLTYGLIAQQKKYNLGTKKYKKYTQKLWQDYLALEFPALHSWLLVATPTNSAEEFAPYKLAW